MKEVRTIPFLDIETRSEGVAIIRATQGCVGICLSLSEDGDIEVVLDIKHVHDLVIALKEAAAAAQDG
jgi:hypothetical protein